MRINFFVPYKLETVVVNLIMREAIVVAFAFAFEPFPEVMLYICNAKLGECGW